MLAFNDYCRCDFCENRRPCARFLFDERSICEDCYDAHVRPCPTCNDILIDEEEQCSVCTVFFPLRQTVGI